MAQPHFAPPIMPDVVDMRRTVKELNSRHLLASGVWLAELLLTVDPNITVSAPNADPAEEEVEDEVYAAMESMRAHEYGRAAHFLKDAKSERAQFLSVYAQFLASERAATQEYHAQHGTRSQPPAPVNNSLPDLYQLVEGTSDPWLQFLEGLFLYRLRRRQEAVDATLKAIAGKPWNWAAWCLLSDCVDRAADFDGISPRIPIHAYHPAVYCWHLKIYNELMLDTASLSDHLLQYFAGNPWLLTQKARALSINGYLPEAQDCFESILTRNPARLDNLDVFSNILNMAGNVDRLAYYATIYAAETNRPEACVLIGQTFAGRGDNEKAIKYYIRATNLLPTYGPAFHLLGQAYIDVANIHAAIQAFRRGAEISKKDTRCWYGLGNCYRRLGLPVYAIYYFGRSLNIRPKDIVVIEHMGMTYEEIGHNMEAAASYSYGIDVMAPEKPVSLCFRLAKLTRQLSSWETVVEAVVESEEPAMLTSEMYAVALNECAEHYMAMDAEGGDLMRAKEYLQRAAGMVGVPNEATRANATLSALKAKMAARGFRI